MDIKERLAFAQQYFQLAKQIETLAFSCHYTEACMNRLFNVCTTIQTDFAPSRRARMLDDVELLTPEHEQMGAERMPIRYMQNLLQNQLEPALCALLLEDVQTNTPATWTQSVAHAESLYCVHLPAPAQPSFCSFGDRYAATGTEVEIFLKAWRGEAKQWDIEAEKGESCLLKIFEIDYINCKTGKSQASCSREIFGWYSDEPLVSKLEQFGIVRWEKEGFEMAHQNIWDCTYDMRADSVQAEIVYAGIDGEYFRFIRAAFRNLTFKNHSGAYLPIHHFWGNCAVLAEKNNFIYNRLMFQEREFDTREAMERDLRFPEPIDFSGFMDDIFGDG